MCSYEVGLELEALSCVLACSYDKVIAVVTTSAKLEVLLEMSVLG